MSIEIIERIKKDIADLKVEGITESVGIVTVVGDGIAEIEGIADAQMMEMVVFDIGAGQTLEETIKNDDALYGLILNLEEDNVESSYLRWWWPGHRGHDGKENWKIIINSGFGGCNRTGS